MFGTRLAHGLHNGDAESSGRVLEQEVRFGSWLLLICLGCIWPVSTWVGGCLVVLYEAGSAVRRHAIQQGPPHRPCFRRQCGATL